MTAEELQQEIEQTRQRLGEDELAAGVLIAGSVGAWRWKKA